MPPSKTSRRLLCSNCNICLDKSKRYHVHDLPLRFISKLGEWISPVTIAEEDYICKSCYELLAKSIMNELTTTGDVPQAAELSRLGHRQVCCLCGRSLLQRQSHSTVFDNPSDEQTRICAVIETEMAPRQMSLSDRICHPCWLRCKRTVVRIRQADEARSTLSTQEDGSGDSLPITFVSVNETLEVPSEVSYEVPSVVTSKVPSEVSYEVPSVVTSEVPSKVTSEVPSKVRSEVVPGNITLENYRRAANTASHCIFPQCSNLNLHIVPDSFRASILSTHKYYIPVLTRVCTEHRQSNEWSSLYNSCNSIRTFTAQQIEHIFSFVNNFKTYINFTNIEAVKEIDDNIFSFWIGMSKKDFFTLLDEVPRIKETHKGVLGLATLLMKKKTGETNVRLSLLLDVPRTTLESLMKKCREILNQDFPVLVL